MRDSNVLVAVQLCILQEKRKSKCQPSYAKICIYLRTCIMRKTFKHVITNGDNYAMAFVSFRGRYNLPDKYKSLTDT